MGARTGVSIYNGLISAADVDQFKVSLLIKRRSSKWDVRQSSANSGHSRGGA